MKSMKKYRRLLVIFAVLVLCAFYTSRTDAKVIYTGKDKIDTACEIILAKCSDEKMTSKEKLKAVYEFLVKNMKYSHSKGSVKIKVSKDQIQKFKKTEAEQKAAGQVSYSKKFRRRYQNVLTMRGTCYDMSTVFCIMANHLGFKAGLCSGRYVRSNGSSCEHWWNYVKIDGKKKYFDVQAANASWKGHHKMSKSFFWQDKNSHAWSKHHD